jgi:hypothetical protein
MIANGSVGSISRLAGSSQVVSSVCLGGGGFHAEPSAGDECVRVGGIPSRDPGFLAGSLGELGGGRFYDG